MSRPHHLELLRDLRVKRALTQAAAAEQVGIHVQYFSAIECGRRTPGVTVARRLRAWSGDRLQLDDLLTGNERKAA